MTGQKAKSERESLSVATLQCVDCASLTVCGVVCLFAQEPGSVRNDCVNSSELYGH